jgi:hypothetical protein
LFSFLVAAASRRRRRGGGGGGSRPASRAASQRGDGAEWQCAPSSQARDVDAHARSVVQGEFIASPACCDGSTTTAPATWTQACRRGRTHLASSGLWGGGSPRIMPTAHRCADSIGVGRRARQLCIPRAGARQPGTARAPGTGIGRWLTRRKSDGLLPLWWAGWLRCVCACTRRLHKCRQHRRLGGASCSRRLAALPLRVCAE